MKNNRNKIEPTCTEAEAWRVLCRLYAITEKPADDILVRLIAFRRGVLDPEINGVLSQARKESM